MTRLASTGLIPGALQPTAADLCLDRDGAMFGEGSLTETPCGSSRLLRDVVRSGSASGSLTKRSSPRWAAHDRKATIGSVRSAGAGRARCRARDHPRLAAATIALNRAARACDAPSQSRPISAGRRRAGGHRAAVGRREQSRRRFRGSRPRLSGRGGEPGGSRVAALVAEQKRSDHSGRLVRFVPSSHVVTDDDGYCSCRRSRRHVPAFRARQVAHRRINHARGRVKASVGLPKADRRGPGRPRGR